MVQMKALQLEVLASLLGSKLSQLASETLALQVISGRLLL